MPLPDQIADTCRRRIEIQPMTAAPLTVAFHIGVHKTATSHLQRSLNRAASVLAAEGVQYYGPDHFRLPGQSLPARFGFPRQKPLVPAEPAPHAQMAQLRKDGHRVVLSEENYIGFLNNPRGSGVTKRYPDAGPRLTELATAIEQDIDICIAIRRPTAFVNSAYCQMLLGGRVMRPGLFQKRNPLRSVDWLDLVMRLRATKGVGRLTVWKYEDYAAVFPQIAAHLVGQDHAARVIPAGRHVNVGLSAAAVAEVLQRSADGPVEKIGFSARKLLPVSEDFPPFDGFEPEEHELGDAAYSAQLAGIAQLEGVTLLMPDQT